ncbi:hypothetical protein [Halopseudomonas pelagia]|uniref:hypothetical protein n=1 Tax=Halopseudomonas pelagia TaxID=553151 RepID=UPI0030D78B23|tara:strand:+ start:1680 stop:3053 length:1374 start_codon:yes stop_codon:yes gene_type:complete
MKWCADLEDILRKDPEISLAYLYGTQVDKLPHLINKKPKLFSTAYRLLMFIGRQLRSLSLNRTPCRPDAKITVLAFAGTENQMASLVSTIDAVENKGNHVLVLCSKSVKKSDMARDEYVEYRFSILDVLKSWILLLRRVTKLHSELKHVHVFTKKKYFDQFLNSYTFLVYFYGLLEKIKPEYVMIANDHNVSTRCLLVVANFLRIKTIYIQHASVSSVFPPLRMSYAFLDGQAALDIYKECELNDYGRGEEEPLPEIFLTGQKKETKCVVGSDNCVGVAINALDNPERVIDLVANIVEAGKYVYFRWHPAQQVSEVDFYKEAFGKNAKVVISDPALCSTSEYISHISSLVAGNSSIHLEAALAGVSVIYYESSNEDLFDYYGYVKNGVSKHAKSIAELLAILDCKDSDVLPDKCRLKYYSETYGTAWQGQEGRLVAECLIELSAGKAPSEIFGWTSY